MKEKRQNYILELISAFNIETQDELAMRLRERGFRVTQATVSRDIKELRLVKLTENGVTKYTTGEMKNGMTSDQLIRLFRTTVLSAKRAGQLVILTTISGSAGAAAEVLDNMSISGIVGTIAGDNTIFIAVESEATAQLVTDQLSDIVKRY